MWLLAGEVPGIARLPALCFGHNSPPQGMAVAWPLAFAIPTTDNESSYFAVLRVMKSGSTTLTTRIDEKLQQLIW